MPAPYANLKICPGELVPRGSGIPKKGSELSLLMRTMPYAQAAAVAEQANKAVHRAELASQALMLGPNVGCGV